MVLWWLCVLGGSGEVHSERRLLLEVRQAE